MMVQFLKEYRTLLKHSDFNFNTQVIVTGRYHGHDSKMVDNKTKTSLSEQYKFSISFLLYIIYFWLKDET